MPTFQYVARNRQGKLVTGRTDALNDAQVSQMLREQGLTPTSIEMGTTGKKTKSSGRGGGVKIDDVVILSRQFATMIRAGLPLLETLNILSEQSEKRVIQNVMRVVERDVETGSSLTEAMQKHPKLFNTFFVSMVRAGEASGMLDTILDQIALYMEKVAQIQRKVKSAVMYPASVSVIAIGITIFLMVKIVPVFVEIFEDVGGDLPMPTRVCIAISNTLRNNALYLVLVLVVVIVVFWQMSKTPAGRRLIDRAKLGVPIFGPLFRKVAVARFSRTLGVLIRSGVNILAALEIVAKTANNTVIEEAVYKARVSIQSGETIAQPLRESEVFPPMVVRMIDVGERTGALEGMLSKIADFYEDQVDAAVSALTSLIEPLLIVFLGFVVGFIVIAMFMPMFKMLEKL